MDKISDLKKRWQSQEGKKYTDLLLKDDLNPEDLKEAAQEYFGFVEDEEYCQIPDLRGLPIAGGIYQNIFLAYCDLSFSSFKSCTFRNCQFHSSLFVEASFNYVDFFDCHINSANLLSIEVKNSKATNTSFNYTNFYNAKINGLNITECNMMGSDLRKAKVYDLSLNGYIPFSSAKLPLYLRDVILSNIDYNDTEFNLTFWTEEWLTKQIS